MLVHQIDAEVRKIADLFSALMMGATLTYDAINDEIGRDCRARDRHKLLAAKKLVLEEAGIVMETIWREGYRRLPGIELAKAGASGMKTIRNKAKITAKTLTLGMSAANDIPPDEQRKQWAYISSFNLLAEIARERSLPIKDVSNGPIPYAIVAKSFLDAVNQRRA